jgi:hypothetical protein
MYGRGGGGVRSGKILFYFFLELIIFKFSQGVRPTATTNNSYGASNNQTSGKTRPTGGSMGRSQPISR